MGACLHRGCNKERTHGRLCALHAMERWQALESFRIEEGEPVAFQDVKIQQVDDWRAPVVVSSWVRHGARFDPESRLAIRGMCDGRANKVPPEILSDDLPTVPATGDDYAMTLDEIGEELGVSKHRVRQIIEKTLRKLRRPRRAKFLKEFLDV